MAHDTRRSDRARRALAIAERVPVTPSRAPNEYVNTRREALIRQAGETMRRAERSERTFDSDRPRQK